MDRDTRAAITATIEPKQQKIENNTSNNSSNKRKIKFNSNCTIGGFKKKHCWTMDKPKSKVQNQNNEEGEFEEDSGSSTTLDRENCQIDIKIKTKSDFKTTKGDSTSNEESMEIGSSSEQNNLKIFQFDSKNLNFNSGQFVEDDFQSMSSNKKKNSRDPLSHRIIEKRRRDRMNKCLSELASLIPSGSLKKGRGRIEKTEIVDQAIRHIQHLEHHPCTLSDACPHIRKEFDSESAATSKIIDTNNSSKPNYPIISPQDCISEIGVNSDDFQLGFQKCIQETITFLVDLERWITPEEPLYARLIQHLNKKYCSDYSYLDKNSMSNDNDMSDLKCTNTTVEVSKSNVSGSEANFPYPKMDPNCNNIGKQLYCPSPTEPTGTGSIFQNEKMKFSYPNSSKFYNQVMDFNDEAQEPLELLVSSKHLSSKNSSTTTSPQEQPVLEPLCLVSSINNHINNLDSSARKDSNHHPEIQQIVNGNGIKFKNKIKQRFKQDLLVSVDMNDGVKSADTTTTGSIKQLLCNKPLFYKKIVPIPCFALLDREKKYYIPITIDESLVSSYVRSYKILQEKNGKMPAELQVHPINISVLFSPSLLFEDQELDEQQLDQHNNDLRNATTTTSIVF